MWKILSYSLLLIIGLVASQLFDLADFTIKFSDIQIPSTRIIIPFSYFQIPLQTITMLSLSYIMIEVGFEFIIDKNNLVSHVFDIFIALIAAALPWIFCSLYFYFVIHAGIKESFLVGIFAAPTSAGVLFAMLSAAGLAMTWLFKKARMLAIFDDLHTIILMIPLQIVFVGIKIEVIYLIIIILVMLWLAYKYLHTLYLPISEGWMLIYSLVVTYFCIFLEHHTSIELEVLLPSFAFGCLLFNPYDLQHPEKHSHLHEYLEPEEKHSRFIDAFIKHLFMFLAGCSIPKFNLQEFATLTTLISVIVITVISNIGKMFPFLCYRQEAKWRERLALSVAMFPRGEVGAGVLLVATGFKLHPTIIELAALSLTLNLLLTGFFIYFALWLIKPIYAIGKK